MPEHNFLLTLGNDGVCHILDYFKVMLSSSSTRVGVTLRADLMHLVASSKTWQERFLPRPHYFFLSERSRLVAHQQYTLAHVGVCAWQRGP